MTNNKDKEFEAQASVKSGNYSAAIKLFLEALEARPDDPILHNNLANAFKLDKQRNEAIRHYQRALALDPKFAEAHNNLAGLYAQKGAYSEALHHYKTALHLAPDFTSAHYNLGLLLLRNNQLEAARTQFNNVLSLHPHHLESQFYIGALDLEAGRLAEAEQAFDAVLQQDPEHVEALTNLGVVYLRQDKNQLAIDYFTKALALDNEHNEARNNLASTFMHFDRFENALMHYDALLAKEPKNIEYLYNSGVAEMALGHLSEAISYFDRLLLIQEDHFAALNNLAAIYMRKEEKERAIGLLKRAVKANPEDKTSQHMLQALTQEKGKGGTCIEYAKNLFDNYALYYDQHLQKYLHYSIPNHIVALMDSLAIKKVEHALDLGCGTGLTGVAVRDFTKVLDGVDISSKMLALAESKHIYDKLVNQEALEYLSSCNTSYDVILASDVLPYFGDLDALFQQVTVHLKDKGTFIFTTEIAEAPPWQLQSSVRFAHHKDYLQEIISRHGLQCLSRKEVIARHQEGEELSVYLVAVQRVTQ